MPSSWDTPLPSTDYTIDALYKQQRCAVFINKPDREIHDKLDDMGYRICVLGRDTSGWKQIFEEHSDVFGYRED